MYVCMYVCINIFQILRRVLGALSSVPVDLTNFFQVSLHFSSVQVRVLSLLFPRLNAGSQFVLHFSDLNLK
jgi:hypothetical protein